MSGSDTSLPWFRRVGSLFETSVSFPKPSLEEDRLALPLVAGASRTVKWGPLVSRRLPLVAGASPLWAAIVEAVRRVYTYRLIPDKIAEEPLALEERRLKRDGGNAANMLHVVQKKAPDVFRTIQRNLEAIVPGIMEVRSQQRGTRRCLRFKQHGERTLHLDASQVSRGTLRALGILLAVFQHPPPLLVFLEEVEDSIHPMATAVLMEALEESLDRTRIVITSHSPSALMHAAVTPERTRVVRWELGRSDIYSLRPLLPTPDETGLSVGEFLQFNALPIADEPTQVHGSFFSVE